MPHDMILTSGFPYRIQKQNVEVNENLKILCHYNAAGHTLANFNRNTYVALFNIISHQQ